MSYISIQAMPLIRRYLETSFFLFLLIDACCLFHYWPEVADVKLQLDTTGVKIRTIQKNKKVMEF